MIRGPPAQSTEISHGGPRHRASRFSEAEQGNISLEILRVYNVSFKLSNQTNQSAKTTQPPGKAPLHHHLVQRTVFFTVFTQRKESSPSCGAGTCA